MQLCATTPFARNECVSSTLISYTCLGPTGILDTIVKFIVGIEPQSRVTPYFASSSSLPMTESVPSLAVSVSSSKSGRHLPLPLPLPLSSFLNQSSAPIVSRNCSAVGNPFAVNLPNSVPLIKWSVISCVLGIAYSCRSPSVFFNSSTACIIAFFVGTIFSGVFSLISLNFVISFTRFTIQLC